MWSEPAYSQYELLLKQLHDLNREDKLETVEADLVREQMEEPRSRLTDLEKRLLAGLSSDLYSFSDEEVVRGTDDDDAAKARAGLAYGKGDWVGLLEALRFIHHHSPPALIAYMRGRCWQQLGRPDPAYWFFDRAHQLAPSNRNYAFLRLEALLRTQGRQQAQAEADQLLSSKETPAQLVFGAAKVLYDHAARLPPQEARPLYESIVTSVPAALAAVEQTESVASTMPRSLIHAGHLHLALSFERLSRAEDAARTYAAAISRYPGSDELLMARALFLIRADQDAAAQRDLDVLISRGTHLASAYLFRARHLWLQKDYIRCLEVSERGLQLATRPATRVLFLQWIAISLYERQASLEQVRSWLEDALSLDPMNENVRNNLQVLDQAPAEGHPPLGTPESPDPSTAIRELQDQLQPAA